MTDELKPAVLNPLADRSAGEEIIARTKTWLERAVIGLNLCPFAKSVFVKKQVRYALTAASTADELLAELENELKLLAETDPAELDTTLLVCYIMYYVIITRFKIHPPSLY